MNDEVSLKKQDAPMHVFNLTDLSGVALTKKELVTMATYDIFVVSNATPLI